MILVDRRDAEAEEEIGYLVGMEDEDGLPEEMNELTQCVAYLRATGLTLCLLINFNCAVLKEGIRRVAHTRCNTLDC